jgi:membrane protein
MDAKELFGRVGPVRAAYAEHGLATHAAAIAYRLLIALVPLVLLGIALLGALGLEDTWGDAIAPPLEERLQLQVFAALDHVANDILDGPYGTLLVFASALLVWELARGVRAVTRALNEIHDVEESRSWRRLALVTLGLAVGVGALLVGAALVLVVGGRMGLVAGILRWPVAVLVLGLAIGLLVRYAPAEQPEARWASVGAGVTVGGWLLLSAGFGIWVRDVASYDSATGTLLAFLVLTAYVLALSAMLLVGVEVDEAARTTQGGGGGSGRARSSAARRRPRRSSSRRGS